MRIRVTHSIGDLAADLARIPVKVRRDARAAVRHGAMVGNLIAKEHAKAREGTHGKHYHRAFTWDQPLGSLFGGAGFTAHYGPDPGRIQGGMDFEEGPGPQTSPHNNLEASRKPAIGVVAQDIRASMDDWFW